MMSGLLKYFSKFSTPHVLMRVSPVQSKFGWKQNHHCYLSTKSFGAFGRYSHLKFAFSLSTHLKNISFYSSQPTETEITLAKMLEEEIVGEQRCQKTKTIPSKIDDFEVSLNGSEVTFTKQLLNETIKINFNVNDSVDNLNEHDEDAVPERKSKPMFRITIENSQGNLRLNCSFLPDDQSDVDNTKDVFEINEICIYKENKTDGDYVAAVYLMDYGVYNLLMDWLDEKGISDELARKLSNFSSTYEHNLYISILSELRKFVSHSEL